MANKRRPPPPPRKSGKGGDNQNRPPPPPPSSKPKQKAQPHVSEAPKVAVTPVKELKNHTKKRSGSIASAPQYQPVEEIQIHKFDKGETPPDDLIKLKRLEEGTIVGSLLDRYNRDLIYTYVGTVLISVNPYKVIDDLYNPMTMDSYSNHPQESVHDELPPHIFAIAGSAYHNLMSSWRNQSILISGESGAGKTEACKLVLEYLMEMSARAAKTEEATADEEYGYGLDRLENQCMQAQTIFESFGNAKTVRNNNSSRFGKWIEVLFGHSGNISGAYIKTYLLEKSRLTRVDSGERNYHVFYQMLAYLNSRHGAGDERAARFKLEKSTWRSFAYLKSASGDKSKKNLSIEEEHQEKEQAFTDADNFDKLITSLNIFGLNSEAIDTIMQLLASILHLGNVKFANKRIQNESSDVQGSVCAPPPPGRSESALTSAAELMGVKPEALEKAMCYSSVTAGSDVIEKPNNVDASYRARDALAKGVYEGLFKWIGVHVNKVMKLQDMSANSGKKTEVANKVIGILDIFGFESLQTNSFEQICINYCNEKLHFHFNEECFRIEQQEYVAEGVSVKNVPYIDNSKCINMFEANGRTSSPGIFALIDSEVHAPGGNEAKLLENMYGLLKDEEHLTKPHPREGDSRECFKIIHYAGSVVYNSSGLLEKSRDTIHTDIKNMIEKSSFKLMREIAEIIGEDRGGSKTPGKANKATLGTQFCKQLSSLMATVNAAKPHFVKCMKPNTESSAKSFVVENIVEQLRCAGILSLCELRKVGYCERITFEAFCSKYSCLTGKTCTSAKGMNSVLENLTRLSLLNEDGWVKGHTKIMLKTEQYNTLEKALVVIKKAAVTKIERQVKAWLFRQAFSRVVKAKRNLTSAVQSEKLEEIKSCMKSFEDLLPDTFKIFPVYAKAKNLTARLMREIEAIGLLQKAIDSRHVQTLKSALKAAVDLGYKKDKYKEAQGLLQDLLTQISIDNLQKAIQLKDAAELENAISNAKTLNLHSHEEFKQAEKMLCELKKPKLKKKKKTKNEEVNKAPEAPVNGSEDQLSSSLLDAMAEVENESRPENTNGVEHITSEAASNGSTNVLEEFGLKEESVGRDANANEVDEEKAAGKTSSNVLEEFSFANEEEDVTDETSLEAEFSRMGLSSAPSIEKWRTLVGAADIVTAKLNANTLINPKELSFFKYCIMNAKNETLDDTQATQLKQIQELCTKVERMSKCNENLKTAVYTKNLNNLIDTLDLAEKLGLVSPFVEQAQKLQEELRKLEQEKDVANVKSSSQIIDIAQGSRWRFDKFVKLRSKDEYVKGKWRGRKRLMNCMLQCQRENLPNSLTSQSSHLNKIATSTFKCLLGATGLKKTTFPAGYAHQILKTGLKYEALRDEIAIQQLKQLHNNQDPKSTYIGWLLLCVWISLFCPTIEFELHLINFLAHFRASPLYGPYASYCLEVLQKQFEMEEAELKNVMKKIALPSVDQLSSILQGKSTPFLKKGISIPS